MPRPEQPIMIHLPSLRHRKDGSFLKGRGEMPVNTCLSVVFVVA